MLYAALILNYGSLYQPNHCCSACVVGIDFRIIVDSVFASSGPDASLDCSVTTILQIPLTCYNRVTTNLL